MNKEFRNIIDCISEQYGIKKGEIASKLGVTPSYLSRLITGMQAPSSAIRSKINSVFPDLQVKERPENYIPGVESAILLYLQSKMATINDLAAELNQTPASVNETIYGGFTADSASRWAEVFGFNSQFLLTGEGQLINEKETADGTVPLLPVLAHAGHLRDFADSVMNYECERVVSPVRDAEFAIPIVGESMSPEFPSGSVVFIKKINEKAFIEWGKTYVLDTINGAIIKYLAPGHEKGFLKCISANHDPMYAPFEVALSDVYGIYRVVNMLCMK